MHGLQHTLLSWLAVAVGLSAAAAIGASLWLTRLSQQPGDFRLIASGLALLSLIMALRCGRIARAR